MMRMFVPEKEEVTEGWRKLQREKSHDSADRWRVIVWE
jgi:hypothetical protein